MSKKSKRPTSAAVKAAVDRAEARSEGKPIDEPAVPVDPPIVKAEDIAAGRVPKTDTELKKLVEKAKRKYEAKVRMAYSPELADEICKRMTRRCPIKGRMLSLSEICEAEDMPHEDTVRSWRKLHPDFDRQYARAREERSHIMADEVVEIADTEPDNVRARNRMDARKWHASKVNRRDYGDKVETEITGKDGGPIELNSNMTEAARRLAFMMRSAIEENRKRAEAKQIEADAQATE